MQSSSNPSLAAVVARVGSRHKGIHDKLLALVHMEESVYRY